MASKPQTVRPDTPGGYDNCYTPPYAIWPLVPYIPPGTVIWEPCAGVGYLADALRMCGHTVISTDLSMGPEYDLFTMPTPAGVQMIITNPPYSIKPRVIENLLQRGLPWALLVPTETISDSKSTRDLFPSFGSIEQMYLDGRVSFRMPNLGWAGDGAQFGVMWLSYRLTGVSACEGALLHRLDFQRRVRAVLDVLKVKDANGKLIERIVRGREPTREELFVWSGFGEMLDLTPVPQQAQMELAL